MKYTPIDDTFIIKSKKQQTEELEQKILKFYQQGLSAKQITSRLGISRTTVYACLKKHAVTPDRKNIQEYTYFASSIKNYA